MDIEVLDGLSKKLKEKNYDSCISEAEGYIFLGEDNLKLLKIYSTALYHKKRYSDCLPFFARVSQKESVNAGRPIFKRAIAAINKLYNKKSDKRNAWGNFSGKEEILFGQSLELLLNGNYLLSQESFISGLRMILNDDSVINIWRQSHSNLVRALSGKYSSDLEFDGNLRDVKKIIVSGLGWSGSGAIYDYLCEFKDVVPISGETPYIESSNSLRTIHSSLSKKDSAHKAVLDFFYYTLLGYAYYQDGGDFRTFTHARKKLFSKDQKTYSYKVEVFTRIAAKFLFAGSFSEREKIFKVLASYVVNEFSISEAVSSNQYALLDNVVHINNISCIEFLENTHILCSFRDPRSNYVALLRETGFYSESPDSFIKNYGKKIREGNRKVDAYLDRYSPDSGKAVKKIEFERFVLSEIFRDSLARGMGLSFEKRQKHLKFRPWDSMKNVILYQEHKNQEDIKRIENALKEFCFEPTIEAL